MWDRNLPGGTKALKHECRPRQDGGKGMSGVTQDRDGKDAAARGLAACHFDVMTHFRWQGNETSVDLPPFRLTCTQLRAQRSQHKAPAS